MADNEHREVLTGDGQTVAKTFRGPVWISLSGTFGGGTAKVRSQDESGAFVNIIGATFNAPVDQLLDFPPGAKNVLDIDLAGSTTPSLITNLQGSDR